MIKSMTGYGRGEYCEYNRKLVVEIKSVNHRYNDISVKLARILSGLEETVRKAVAAQVSRGKIDVYVNYEAQENADISISLNEAIADGYYSILKKLKNRYNINEDISLSDLTRFADIISIDKGMNNEQARDELSQVLNEALSQAINSLMAMREKEGAALKSNIEQKLLSVKTMAQAIAGKAPQVALAYKERLTQRLNDALEGVEIDETRLLTEVAVFADKACIDEELTRLSSHIEQMGLILAEGGAVGRKLDFLVQEINREVNTIGSKAQDIEITQTVVELKSEIEKIREQVQNIE